MNREILFKAKRIDSYKGDWVQGYLVRYGFTGQEKYYIVPDYASDLYGIAIDPETICQYTGLTDKDGKKIWENDILSANLDESYPDDTTYAKVVWHKNGWKTQEKNSNDYDLMGIFDEENYVVVGNVFDNKELLEGGA